MPLSCTRIALCDIRTSAQSRDARNPVPSITSFDHSIRVGLVIPVPKQAYISCGARPSLKRSTYKYLLCSNSSFWTTMLNWLTVVQELERGQGNQELDLCRTSDQARSALAEDVCIQLCLCVCFMHTYIYTYTWIYVYIYIYHYIYIVYT